MMRFISQKKPLNNEKTKLSRLKSTSKLAIKMLLQLHQQHSTTHCVLIIGQPESGKSILCAGAGKLLYSSPSEAAFEIYLQHNTLFVQLPQDFFLFSEARHSLLAWHFFALQLKQQSAYLPVTRCLITIDLHDFLTRSKISNDTRLSQISLALNALANVLKKHLKIVLFFTKSDLIPGFNEFFNYESKEFLEQPWGISLKENASEEPERDILNTEFDQLIKKLNERLLWRLHHEIDTEYLHLIKTFPLAMEAIKRKFLEILPGFLTQWEYNKFLHPAQLYFVSCRQFRELTEPTQAEYFTIKKNNHSQTQHKHFFTQQALENQCFFLPKKEPAYINKLTKISFIALCLLLLLAFIFYTSQQFSEHIALTQSANQTLEAGRSFSKKSYSALKLTAVSNELEKISASWEMLKKNQRSMLIEKYIFTRDHQLETQLQNVYQRIISQQWLPLVNQRLEGYIESHLTPDPANAYIAFNIYLMLSQPDWPVNTQYIDAHLSDLLGSANESIQLLPENIQKNLLVVNENSPFTQHTRATFLALPSEKLAYILLFSTLNTHHALNLSMTLNQTQPSLNIESKFALIPEIYTAPLFSEVYKKRLPVIAKETIHGNKILGQIQHENISENVLLLKLKEEYLKLYADTWEQAIKHVSLIQTNTFSDFSVQLKILTSVNSPIITLLNLSQINTFIPEIEQTSPFLTAFNDALTKDSTPENSALYHSFAFLLKLYEEVQKIQNSDDQKTTACILLAQETGATNENPTNAQQIRYLASQLPEPIQTWWLQIVDTYNALLKENAVECR